MPFFIPVIVDLMNSASSSEFVLMILVSFLGYSLAFDIIADNNLLSLSVKKSVKFLVT